MMTTKDFELIARTLRDDAVHHVLGPKQRAYEHMSDWERGAFDQWNTVCISIATMLLANNPRRFDRDKFLNDCGVMPK